MPIPEEIDNELIAEYGQRFDLETLNISTFGQVIITGEEYISDFADRSVNLLIEQFRRPYVAQS